jgi:signal transduction histidine kinase
VKLGAPLAIRTRIALATFLVLAVTLALTAYVMDRVMRNMVVQVMEARLRSEAEALAALTHFDGKRIELTGDEQTLSAFVAPRGGAYYQLTTSAGQVVRSPSLAGAELPAAPPDVAAPVAAGEPRVTWERIDGPYKHVMRMITFVVTRTLADGSRGTLVVQVARSFMDEERAARKMGRVALEESLPFALFLGTLGTFLVARRATAPISRLSRQARAIGGESLATRLDLMRVEGELLELAQTFNSAFDRLAEAAEHEHQFAADAAHELRTPLSLLKTAIELALSRERTPEEYREMLRGMASSSGQLEQVVSGLLLLAKTESSKVAHERLDLRSVAIEAIDTIMPFARSRSVPVKVLVPDDAIWIEGTSPLLERLIANLVENGIRHGASPGGVEVRVEGTADRATVLVLDRGPGLTPAFAPRAFARFSRSDESRARETGGVGLGLAIVRAIARAHGGDAVAEPREGGGAVFRVTLPRVAAKPEPGPETAPE